MDGELITTPDLYQKLADECFKVHAIYKTDTPDRCYAMVIFGTETFRVDFAANDGGVVVGKIELWTWDE